MLFSFSLPTTAFSVNSYYYKSRQFKTKEAKEYEIRILALLEEHKQLHDLADMWRLNGGIFHIAICNNYPHHIYYNRHGQVSSKTFDCDNIIKPLIDLIFGQFMGLNDKYITKIVAEKRVSATYGLDITLELLPANE